MTDALDRFTSNPLGHLIFKCVQPFVHAARHLAHPGLPNDQMITRVSYNGRQLNLRHRRWCESDVLAIQQCFQMQQYNMPTGEQGAKINQIYNKIVASGRKPLIIDCGANIGASVLWFNARYPEAHIVGVEPAPDNFEILQINCANLDVDLRQAGISGDDGRAYLLEDGSQMAYRISTVENGPSVELISIKTILDSKSSSKYTPFLLKIDIEGAEKDLFSGDCSAINTFPFIILEPHDWKFPGELSSREFFRFHAAAGREFCMNNENVGSIACDGASNNLETEPVASGASQTF